MAPGCVSIPNQPPSIEPVTTDLRHWAEVAPADPQLDGLMPLVLRWTEVMSRRVAAEGLRMNMVCARGPMAVGSWLVGITNLLENVAVEPWLVSRFLESLTTTIIRWLQAQLDCLPQPEGILLLDDVAGMVSRRTYDSMVAPHMRRIFDAFQGLVRIYHNDTPCRTCMPALARPDFDVLNFSHEVPLSAALEKAGGRYSLMGNVPPLDLGYAAHRRRFTSRGRACLESRTRPGWFYSLLRWGRLPGNAGCQYRCPSTGCTGGMR